MPELNYLNKIALGTAQFGLNYGISNQAGQSSFPEVCRILEKAAALGTDTLDTAAAYGNSEEIIGKALKETGKHFKIVTKISGNETELKKTVAYSLEKLQQKSVYGCLFHDYKTYQEKPEILAELQELKAAGQIQKIGFSLYYPQQAKELLAKSIDFDLVQVPYNLFDRRFETVFPELKKSGVEIHTRSAFLQGLFFPEAQEISPFFGEILPLILAVKAFARKHEIPLAMLLLGFAALNSTIDKVVIGVENALQLSENAAFVNYLPQLKNLIPELQNFALENEQFLLPFNWKI